MSWKNEFAGRPDGGRRHTQTNRGVRLSSRDTAGHGVKVYGRMIRRRADRAAVARGLADVEVGQS